MSAEGESILAFLERAISRTEATAHEAAEAPVLRHCAADRTLLALHQADLGNCVVCAHEETFSEDSEGEREWSRSAMSYPCPTVLAVAEGYGWAEASAPDPAQTPPTDGVRVT